MTSKCRVLLAEDDEEMRGLLTWYLEQEGFQVDECRHGLELLEMLEDYLSGESPGRYDLIISDIRMPGVTGMEVLEAASQSQVFPPMILITAFGDESTHRLAGRLGAKATLDKPFELEELMGHVRRIVVEGSARSGSVG